MAAYPIDVLAVEGDGLLVGQDSGFSRHAPSCLQKYSTVTGRPYSGFGVQIHLPPGYDAPCVGTLLLTDGALFVGGNFERVDGVARPSLARLDPRTGALDRSWWLHGQALRGPIAGAGLLIGSAGNGRLGAATISTGARDRRWIWPPPRGFNCCAAALATVGHRLVVAADSIDVPAAVSLPSERLLRYPRPAIDSVALVATPSGPNVLIGLSG